MSGTGRHRGKHQRAVSRPRDAARVTVAAGLGHRRDRAVERRLLEPSGGEERDLRAVGREDRIRAALRSGQRAGGDLAERPEIQPRFSLAKGDEGQHRTVR